MMEKLAQFGEGGGVHALPTLFHNIYHHVQSIGVRSSWMGNTLPLFLLYPSMYSVGINIPPSGGRKTTTFVFLSSFLFDSN
jgi:hypothetical protein